MKKNTTSQKNIETVVTMRVASVTLTVNAILAIGKLLAGIIASSNAMVSDAIHTASDVISTIIVMVGVSLANKKSDAEHPYGHERLECVASIILATLLSVTGVGIGYDGIKLIFGDHGTIATPGKLALIAAAVSILTKEAMYWWTRSAAKKINSGALMADAWHHRSDALSSIGALIGIGGAILGFPVLEPIASVVICVFILKAAFDIFKDAVNKMVDKAAPAEVAEQMRELILSEKGVVRVDDIKTRLFAEKLYVDVEIAVDGDLPLYRAHKIAETVHAAIESNFPNVKHCMVHENPVKNDESDDENESIGSNG